MIVCSNRNKAQVTFTQHTGKDSKSGLQVRTTYNHSTNATQSLELTHMLVFILPHMFLCVFRCLLAASSPVLASIVSSAGVLVELQDQCLSDSVLAHLLDYIYTGVLPDSHKQEQYSMLLTAAGYLQMNELQEALTAAWKKAEGNVASDGGFWHREKINRCKDSKNTPMEVLRICSDHQPSAPTVSLRGPKETSTRNYVEMFNDCSQKSDIKSKDLPQNISCNGGIKSEVFKRTPDKDLLKTSDKWISSSVSHPCYGAVPVICHSSRADVLHLADSPSSPYFPVTSSKVPVSHSTSARSEGCVNGKHRDHDGAQKQQNIHNEKNIRRTNPLVADQDFNNTVAKDQAVGGFSTNTGSDDLHNHSDLLQLNPKFHRDYLASVKTVLKQGIKHKTDEDFGDFPSKHQHLDIHDNDEVSLTTATEEQSHWNSSARHPRKDSDVESKSCLEMEVRNEHCYSSRCLTERDTKEGSYDPYGCNSETATGNQKTRNDIISRHDYDSNRNLKAVEIRRHSLDVCPVVSTTGLDSDNPSEQEKGSASQTVHLTRPEEKGSEFCQSNQRYLFYSRPQEEMDVLPKTCGFTCDFTCDHSDQSDDVSDGYEADVLYISGQNSLKQHFDAENSQQDFLLDTNTKPGKVLEMNGKGMKDAASSVSDHKDQSNEALSTGGAKLKLIHKCSNFQNESFESLTKDQSSNESQTPQGDNMTEVSKLNEDENISSRLVSTCSSLIVPSCVQTSVPPTLTACVSSSLSASTPAEKPASALSPAHHLFQCSLCDRSFSQRGSLNRHVRSHLGVRPFSCPFCPMTFSRQYRVTEHMRVHQRCALGTDFQKNR